MLTIENNQNIAQQILKLKGGLCGIDALHFREKVSSNISIKEGTLLLDLSQLDKMDLTGFNAIVMLKKAAIKHNLSFLIIAGEDNPMHEFIHLSKLSFNYVNQQSS